ncbi:MAG: hypothetical protein KAG61_00425 [Bacteriovoracaceae bacterium]|nr:hypothetical protein [Bacteriovoracaceae bacterium]
MNPSVKYYLVGGAVRDSLMGLPEHDRDYVVVGCGAEEMINKGFICVGNSFSVFLHPKNKEEYVLADETLEEDLARRDLTINAIALDLDTNEIIDPYNGRKDIKEKILRHVGESFKDDPIRVLRCARFCARLGFSICNQTLEYMSMMVRNGYLNDLTPERVFLELDKAITASRPSVFFDVLQSIGALDTIFPEANFKNIQRDVYKHSLAALNLARSKTNAKAVLFAVMFNGLVKDRLDMLCERLAVPNSYRNLAQRVCTLHGEYDNLFAIGSKRVLKLLDDLKHDRSDSYLEEYILCCESKFTVNVFSKKERDDYLCRSEQLLMASSQICGLDFTEINLNFHQKKINLKTFLKQRYMMKIKVLRDLNL